jgi:outer membrane lipoprotein SlyB
MNASAHVIAIDEEEEEQKKKYGTVRYGTVSTTRKIGIDLFYSTAIYNIIYS